MESQKKEGGRKRGKDIIKDAVHGKRKEREKEKGKKIMIKDGIRE